MDTGCFFTHFQTSLCVRRFSGEWVFFGCQAPSKTSPTHTCCTPCHQAKLLQISPWVCDTHPWPAGRGIDMAWTSGHTRCTPEHTGHTGTSSGQHCTPGLSLDEKAWETENMGKRDFNSHSKLLNLYGVYSKYCLVQYSYSSVNQHGHGHAHTCVYIVVYTHKLVKSLTAISGT